MPLKYKLFIVFMLISPALGSFNFYMDGEEVKRILGLSKELFYVREGVANTYALNFVVTLPPNVSSLKFTWEATHGEPPYILSPSASDPFVLHPLHLSIPKVGNVSKRKSSFHLETRCNGLKTAEVLLELNATVGATSFSLKRKKVCIFGVDEKPPKKIRKPNKEKSEIPPNYILATILATLLILSIILVAAYLRKRKTSKNSHATEAQKISNTFSTTSSSYNSRSPFQVQESCYDIYYEIPENPSRRLAPHSIRLDVLLVAGPSGGLLYQGTLPNESKIIVKTTAEHGPKFRQMLLLNDALPFVSLETSPKIISILGIAESPNLPPYIVYEDFTFLKWSLGFRKTIKEDELVSLAINVAEGVAFLHERGIVHGAVGGRCLGVANGLIKLGDAALASDLFPGDFEMLDGVLKPLRWQPPEAFCSGWSPSFVGDVWSLCVTIWELSTLCKETPFGSISSAELPSYLLSGGTLDFNLSPRGTFSPELITIVLRGMNADDGERTSVRGILNALKTI